MNEKERRERDNPKPEAETKESERSISRPPGFYSNARITARNGGVRHQFLNDIGGCSANYR